MLRVRPSDYAAACVRYDRELREAEPLVLHRGQATLDRDAAAVLKRTLGGSWAWLRPDNAPITALVAATVAAWGIDHTEAPADEPGFWIG